MIKNIILLKNLYYFFLKVNSAFSYSFLRSQCYFHIILKTYILNIIYNLQHKFEPKKGNLHLDQNEINYIYDEIEKLVPRISNKYFKFINLEHIPSFAKKIVQRHKNDIELFLGKNFVFEKMTFTLTKHIPNEFEHFDFYSNAWHTDSDSHKILKIFILIEEVTDKDGPFIYLSDKKTTENWRFLRDRFINSIVKVEGENHFTGKRGDYFIIDTSKNLHRASNPAKDRKLLTLTLYPKWSQTSDVARFEWNSIS